MKWFDRWFIRKCRWASENQHLIEDKNQLVRVKDVYAAKYAPNNISDLEQGYRLNVIPARGGTVLQVVRYNPHGTDHCVTYVLGQEEPFNEGIAQILSMEMIR
jgi:hypothetical protein